jgi:acid phosphatase
VPRLKRIVVVIFENQSYGDVIGQPSAPTFNRMATRYALLTRYYGVAHPSLPNYLALVSGSTQGVLTDCTDCSFDARNLADTIKASGRTWKTYAEGLPEPGFTGSSSGRYAKKHNPFLYFQHIASSPATLRRIVPFPQFASDLARGRLPAFSLVVPDLCNDMHDCSTSTGDAWLAKFLPPLLSSKQLAGSAVFVTFDESPHGAADNHVATLVLGPMVRRGARSKASYTHYSLLRTIEDAWRLRPLGRSATAVPVTGIWR